MRALGWLPLYLLCLSAGAGCTRALDDAPCPCAPGYVCCVTRNVCYPADQTCAEEGGAAGRSSSAPPGGEPHGDGEGGEPTGPASGGGSARAQGGESSNEANGGEPSAGGPIPYDAPRFALVATQHNDNQRSGANLEETALTASNVNVAGFGELSRRPVRGAVFAQPLVAPDVAREDGSRHAIVYVATMANVVYALDARHPDEPPIWSRTLAPPIELPDPAISLENGQIWHEVGVLGTPVLAPELGALFVVATTKSGDDYGHRVYKLALSSGEVLASANCAHADFDSAPHAQRAALTLANDVLYVPFGGYEPSSNQSGWIFRFDVGLSPLGAVRLDLANAAGVTMTGQGPAVDDRGTLLFSTNLALAPQTPLGLFPSRLLQWAAGQPLPVEAFLPRASMDSLSDELGRGGPIWIPRSERGVLAGQRRMYALGPSAASPGAEMTLLQEPRPSVASACSLSADPCDSTPSSPVFWPGSGSEPEGRVFVWPPSDQLRAFGFDAGTQRLDCDDDAASCLARYSSSPSDSLDVRGHALAGAAYLSVSSNGRVPGSGVVWAAHAYANEDRRASDGILRAFDAEDLSLSWSTEDAGTPLGPLATGATPTISGGRVFLGTSDGVSGKQIFWEDATAGTPAITGFRDEALVLAWSLKAPQSPGFQLKWSTDGVHFTQTSSVTDDIGFFEPALASDDARIYLAWTAASGLLKVAVSSEPSFARFDWMKQRGPDAEPVKLAYQPSTAPALTYGNGKLFLAFNRGDEIVVVSSRDGAAFDTSTELVLPGLFSSSPPLLTYLNDRLYLISTDPLRRMRLLVSADDGAHFSAPTLLSMSSVGHPALMASSTGSAAPDLHLAWPDVTTDDRTWGRIKLASTTDGDAYDFARVHQLESDQADFSINAARFKGAWYIAWLGILDAPQPNVARYTPGELVTYGLKSP